MDKKTKELLVKMAGQPDSLRKDKFIREYRKYNKKNNKNTRNNENNVMSKDGWNNKNNENTKRNTNNETTLCFIMSQFSYISWYVWCISLFVLIAAIFIIVMKVESTDSITVVSASIPFVAMAAVMESFRSKYYGMSELESVTKVSFRGIYFARTSCIGIVHIVILSCLIIMIGRNSENGYYFYFKYENRANSDRKKEHFCLYYSVRANFRKHDSSEQPNEKPQRLFAVNSTNHLVHSNTGTDGNPFL